MTDKFLNILHVGGRGSGIGPIADLIKVLKDDVDLTIFEADFTLENAGLPKIIEDAKIISKCLSNYIGKSEFNINVDSRSSSLFKVSHEAIDYLTPNRWGDSCKTVKTITVDVTTINELIKNKEIKSPHFISIDAQGSEYNILEGASTSLSNDLIAIITEVEFREIYENQKLFSDIDLFLKKYNFKLFHFFNWQHWRYQNKSSHEDTGFPLTSEVLYLRDFNYFLKKEDDVSVKISNLVKLSMLASFFEKSSYANMIIEYIEKNFKSEFEEFLKKESRFFTVKI